MPAIEKRDASSCLSFRRPGCHMVFDMVLPDRPPSTTAPTSSDLEGDPRVATILDVMAKETGVDRSRLDLAARIDDLGVSSLDMTQAVFELESRFDIELPVVPAQGEADRSGAEFATVGDLVQHVLATLDRRAPA